MKQLFLISHETTTAVQVGVSVSGIPSVEADRIAALNAFLTINHQKNLLPVWDDDDIFEEILDSYTFITVNDANNSIYSNEKFSKVQR